MKNRLKTKIKIEGVVTTKRKDLLRMLRAIETTGLEINYSAVAKEMGISISTLFDVWSNFKKNNKLDVVINIGSKDFADKLSSALKKISILQKNCW